VGKWVICKTHKDVIPAIEKDGYPGCAGHRDCSGHGARPGGAGARQDQGLPVLSLPIQGGWAGEMVRARPNGREPQVGRGADGRLAEQMNGHRFEKASDGPQAESQRILDEDIRINRRIAKNVTYPRARGVHDPHHCNAGYWQRGATHRHGVGVIRQPMKTQGHPGDCPMRQGRGFRVEDHTPLS